MRELRVVDADSMVGEEIADLKGRVRISNKILQSEHHCNAAAAAVVVVG